MNQSHEKEYDEVSLMENDNQNRGKNKDSLADINGKTIYKVRIIQSSNTEFCVCTDDFHVKKGDYVIVPTRYGKDIGRVLGAMRIATDVISSDVLTLERLVTESEWEEFQGRQEKNRKAFEICREKINEHNLSMKLVSAHHLIGEPKILFFFTAESRVDFRELVKNLVSIFHTRIELRQIGVRDESRVIGGIGVCGRNYCCHALTDKLNPVSIRMAKKQNLSLNSLKISGPCGRLLCCLSYEYPYYKEIRDSLPAEGAKILFEGEKCKVIEINIMSQYLKLSSESGRTVDIQLDRVSFNKEESRWTVVQSPPPV